MRECMIHIIPEMKADLQNRKKTGMSEQLSYHQIMNYIQEQTGRGSILGLESIRELCSRLGNPQDKLQFIHIAGSNGKGSTLAYTSTILKACGYKVGRYISPVINHYRERIQVNGKPILAKELTQVMNLVKEAADSMEADGLPYPTAFELETAAGFVYFLQTQCDVVVLETGMGGDLDATNVVKNTLISVFASISMDHMGFLGNTLSEIAQKKAGIMKPGADAISTCQESDAKVVLEKHFAEVNKEVKAQYTDADYANADKENAGKAYSDSANADHPALIFANRDKLTQVKYGLTKQSFTYTCVDGTLYKKMEIPLAGVFQIDNAVTALETVNHLKNRGWNITEEKIRKGFLMTTWPARLEILAKKPMFVIDGAHNEDAAKRLASSIRFYFTNKRLIYIMGMLKDKEYEKVIAETYAYADQIITVTTPNNPRALPAQELANTASQYHPSVTSAGSLEEAVEMAYLMAEKEDVILAFGSLSYLGRMKEIVEALHDKNRK